ncbi:hypothetical protein Bca4012_051296 [Brassica carinata]|uniref:Uncharacterized protein n=1 Tax=Brassica carinata TaxID=52824 RepID=A0A8X7R4V0_BRACI|nr:hypothetical protein Bca52824_053918 [Brassica carinata]
MDTRGKEKCPEKDSNPVVQSTKAGHTHGSDSPYGRLDQRLGYLNGCKLPKVMSCKEARESKGYEFRKDSVVSQGPIGSKEIQMDLGHYSVAGESKSERSRKSKQAAGHSGQVIVDGTNPTGLPTDPVVANTGGELPTDPANITGTHQGNENGQQHQERE